MGSSIHWHRRRFSGCIHDWLQFRRIYLGSADALLLMAFVKIKLCPPLVTSYDFWFGFCIWYAGTLVPYNADFYSGLTPSVQEISWRGHRTRGVWLSACHRISIILLSNSLREAIGCTTLDFFAGENGWESSFRWWRSRCELDEGLGLCLRR